jgi:hypothetical protein
MKISRGDYFYYVSVICSGHDRDGEKLYLAESILQGYIPVRFSLTVPRSGGASELLSRRSRTSIHHVTLCPELLLVLNVSNMSHHKQRR